MGDDDVANLAIDKIDANYKIDGLAMRLDTVEAVSRAPEGVPDFHKLYHSTEELLDSALAADRYDLAKRSCEVLTEFAQKVGDAGLIRQCASKSERVASFVAAYDGVKDAEAVLERPRRTAVPT